ncbi:hypothetical protein ONA91_35690 [Micromonospora sp. DR5-3]|uniref:DUF6924 domain-containing protein n=1 Tax=unclassified Micromonospora TaxID=2617518 RepID=UPI0011D4BFC1|nr:MULTISPECIES: hypothetical protein [unclassified Micromonospora]MCW3819792.1 hypothetical protein [Micromonospora sp. DR5-3]TYC19638.1 hypothetical protein FXF52_35585 [Micromonospora sp. MP36]
MADLPETWCVPVVRVDFSDDGVWELLKDEIVSPTDEGFVAGVEFVEDRALIGLSGTAVATSYPRAYPRQYRHPVVFVVDAVTISLPERPLLVVNLNEGDETGPFRTLPRQVQAIENNLSIANMDFLSSRGRQAPTASFEASNRNASRPNAAPGCTDLAPLCVKRLRRGLF